jgi:hypothetical protein
MIRCGIDSGASLPSVTPVDLSKRFFHRAGYEQAIEVLDRLWQTFAEAFFDLAPRGRKIRDLIEIAIHEDPKIIESKDPGPEGPALS